MLSRTIGILSMTAFYLIEEETGRACHAARSQQGLNQQMNGKIDINGFGERTPTDLNFVVEKLRTVIEEKGALPPERVLSDLLDIKRHQIRRGLEALRASGEIAPPKPRRPAASKENRLADMASNTNPIEVVEMRLMIEPTLAKLAARRATPNQIAAMQKAIVQNARGEGKTGGEADLHRMIASASGNALADEFHRLLRNIEADARLRTHFIVQRDRQDYTQHKAIVEAIAARDPDEAERQMRLHIETLRATMMAGAE
jgi:DNA-binding FadR family transcriptional regulator